MWAPIRLPRVGGATHANGYNNRPRHCEVGLPGPRSRCCWTCDHPPSVEASLCPGVLSETATVPGRHRSLRLVAPLVARTSSDRPHRSADAAGLREALRQAAEE